MLEISRVIPRDPSVSLAAKNPVHCFGKDRGGYSSIDRGVRIIPNIWLVIYYLEETFIYGSAARPCQAKDDESVYEEWTCQFHYYFKGVANRKITPLRFLEAELQ